MAVASEPYRQMLLRWLPFARDHFTRCDDEADGGFFGTGYNCLGTMAQASFVCAVGYLAGLPLKDWPADCRVSKDEAADMLRLAFRFLFRTHVTAGGRTNNGQPWGFGSSDYDLWHPPLYFEQALTALPCYRELLDKADLARMEAALVYEADRHEQTGLSAEAHSLPSRAGHESTAESNSWTAAMLARAAVLMPANPRAGAWLQAASLFWMNGLSVPQDEWDPAVVDGRPRSSWFAGANLGPHYTLEHHGFFHPGYYVWSLWPMCTALLEFRRAGRPPLQAASHHFREAFDVLKRLVAWNGRLVFPAGADWPQYMSGTAFLLPVCEYAARAGGDAEAAHVAETMRTNLAAEQAANSRRQFRVPPAGGVPPLSTYRLLPRRQRRCVRERVGCHLLRHDAGRAGSGHRGGVHQANRRAVDRAGSRAGRHQVADAIRSRQLQREHLQVPVAGDPAGRRAPVPP